MEHFTYKCMNVFVSFNMENQAKLLKRNILLCLGKKPTKTPKENIITK